MRRSKYWEINRYVRQAVLKDFDSGITQKEIARTRGLTRQEVRKIVRERQKKTLGYELTLAQMTGLQMISEGHSVKVVEANFGPIPKMLKRDARKGKLPQAFVVPEDE